jgi:hypothetical protein
MSGLAVRADSWTHDVLVVVGAPGEESYASGFERAAEAWKSACQRAGASCVVVGVGAEAKGADAADDRTRVAQWFAARDADSPAPLWFVYVGHGTFDGKVARLNLRGPDLSSEDLNGWLGRLAHRTAVVIIGGSASGPFIPALSAPNRIVISATRSGDEVNYARFGERLAAAIANPEADIDQDGQTSLLEAFLTASKDVQTRYAELSRMATEHALLDDNGDKRGTPADWFQGTRLVKRPDAGAEADGLRASQIVLVGTAEERALTSEQRKWRDDCERELAALRARKETLPEGEYWARLEAILRRLSALYVQPPKDSQPAPAQPAPSRQDSKAGPRS